MHALLASPRQWRNLAGFFTLRLSFGEKLASPSGIDTQWKPKISGNVRVAWGDLGVRQGRERSHRRLRYRPVGTRAWSSVNQSYGTGTDTRPAYPHPLCFTALSAVRGASTESHKKRSVHSLHFLWAIISLKEWSWISGGVHLDARGDMK